MKGLNEKLVCIFYSVRYNCSLDGKDFKYIIAIDPNYNAYFIISKYDELFNKNGWAYTVEDIIEGALGNEKSKKKINDAYDEVISQYPEFDLYNDAFIQKLYIDKRDKILDKYNDLFAGTDEPVLTGPLSEKIITMHNITTDQLDKIIESAFTHEQILNNDSGNVIYNFAKSYYNNNNITKYIELLKKGEEYNHINSIFYLAYCYSNGIGLKKNRYEAFKRYKICSEHNNAAAMFNLGQYYYYGHNGVVDYFKAFEYYKKAADNNYKLAIPKMAFMYYEGLGTEVNIQEALNYALKGVEIGNSYCKYSAGYIYSILEDYEKSVHYLTMACDEGYPDAFSVLGYFYANGIGVQKDLPKAIELYNKANENDVSSSYYNLAMCYYNGEGVLKDKKKAIELLEKGAKKRDFRAQLQLGYFYEIGDGCITDYEKAKNWYYRALVNGHEDAQRYLDNIFIKIKEKNSKSLDALYYGFTPVSKYSNDVYIKHINEKLLDILNDETVKDDETLYLNSENPDDKYALALLLFKKEQLKKADEIIELLKSASDDNYHKAILALGAFYFRYATGVCYKDSKVEAVKCFKRAAKLNNPDAQYLYAYCCANGIGCEVNQDESLLYYYLASKYNNEDAMVYVHCLSGSDKIHVQKLYENYLNEFILEHGSFKDCLELAKQYIANSEYKQAYLFLNKCKQENDAYVYYLLALCSEKNNGHLDAVLELVKSAELGYNVAQYELGYYLSNKICVANRAVTINPSDFIPNTSEYWLKLASDSKYIPAIIEYSKLLERNSNVGNAINFVLGYEDLKHVDIYYTLGTLYTKNRDYENAYKYLNLAWNLGKNEVNFDIGLLYLYGNGVKKDVNKAINCFELTAYLENSCYYLGNIYEKEEGFIDYQKAYYWYVKGKEACKYSSNKFDIKIERFDENKCPVCGSYYSKITKKTLFGSKTICSKCKNNL